MAVELPITDDFEEGCLARSQDVLEALGLTDDEPPEEAPALLEPPAPAAMKSEAASAVEANSPTLRLRDRRSIKKPAHAEFDDDSPRATTDGPLSLYTDTQWALCPMALGPIA